MKTRSEILKMRAELYDRLTLETHQIDDPQNDDQLNNFVPLLAGIRAIDIVIEQDLFPNDDAVLAMTRL